MGLFSKTLAGVGAIALSATPALAESRHASPPHHDNTGAIIAGALLIGGIAAIAASSDHHDYDRSYDRRYGFDGYDQNGDYRDGYVRRGDRYAPPPRSVHVYRDHHGHSGDRDRHWSDRDRHDRDHHRDRDHDRYDRR
jgi:hypothetical protein